MGLSYCGSPLGDRDGFRICLGGFGRMTWWMERNRLKGMDVVVKERLLRLYRCRRHQKCFSAVAFDAIEVGFGITCILGENLI